ncbi:RidA family protein [Buchnera aphidicola]|uniref:RidA family protein n=1 Tax=Buchnera aphidicola TaxID=9 RepID=UPI000A90A6D3|nr:RidA family protein [Buchnera aphidicola]
MLKKKYILNKTFGPYSPIIQVNNLFFISGQIPIYHRTGVIPDNLYEQTSLALNNIRVLLKKSNLHIRNIVKITIFTTKINQLNEINLSYQEFFNKYTLKYPARSCIGISALPKKVDIEIEAIAAIL